MNIPEKPAMISPLTDVRQAPLGRLTAPQTLERLRPVDAVAVVVGAFNASL